MIKKHVFLSHEYLPIWIGVGLLAINTILLLYIGFFKHDAMWLETLKVGGKENMKMARQLYTSDIYIQQQKMTLEQIL